MEWQIDFYQFSGGSSPVLAWFLEQQPEVQAEFARIFDLLKEHGISVGMPHIRSITDSKLFEIRVRQNKNIYRIFYFAYTGRRFILLHGFQKKTQKTPKTELEIATVRMKEFLAQQKQETGKSVSNNESSEVVKTDYNRKRKGRKDERKHN